MEGLEMRTNGFSSAGRGSVVLQEVHHALQIRKPPRYSLPISSGRVITPRTGL
jgi:hypothetical protein